MKKTAFIIMLLTLLSKVFGFARDIILANYYGASNISDAYLISLTIPTVIFGFIGAGISTSFIPLYTEVELEKGNKEANFFTSNLINILMVIFSAIIVFGILFSNEIVTIFASGFDSITHTLAVKFTRISLFGIYFAGIVYIFMGYLQVKGNFTIPALVGFPLNIFTILAIIASYHYDIIILAIGGLVAVIAQVFFLIPSMTKTGYTHQWVFKLNDSNIKRIVKIAIPVIIGISVNQINVLVDRTIASQLASGAISSLNYANKLILFIQAAFVASISTAMYPSLSKFSSTNDYNQLKKIVREAISIVTILVMPIGMGAIVFSKQIIQLLFVRGAFDNNAFIMTSSALSFYSIGMIGYGLREIISRTFYSIQDTKTPMINAAISMLLNIGLNIVLSRYLGVGGLALATSISALFCTVLLVFSLRKKIGALGLKSISTKFIRISFASLIMGIIAYLLFNSLTLVVSNNLALLISILSGALIYVIMIWIMKIEEMEVIKKVILKKFFKISNK